MAWGNGFFSGLKFENVTRRVTDKYKFLGLNYYFFLRRVFGDGKELHQILITTIGVKVNQIIKMVKDAWNFVRICCGMIIVAMA